MLAPLLDDPALPLWPTDGKRCVFDERLYGEEATAQKVPHQSFMPDQFDTPATHGEPQPVLSVHMTSDTMLVSTHADTTLRLWDV